VQSYVAKEVLSLYLNKPESIGLRKCPYYHYLAKKVLSQLQTFFRACPTSRREISWHRIWYEEISSLSPSAYDGGDMTYYFLKTVVTINISFFAPA